MVDLRIAILLVSKTILFKYLLKDIFTVSRKSVYIDQEDGNVYGNLWVRATHPKLQAKRLGLF
jgi:hypothetical protein